MNLDQATFGGLFGGKRLGPSDARASFAIARLAQPGLSLAQWRARLTRNTANKAIVGIFNRTGCLVALISVTAGTPELVFAPPLFMGAEQEAMRLARELVADPRPH